MKLTIPIIKLVSPISLALLGCTDVQAQPVIPTLTQGPVNPGQLTKPLVFAAPPPPSGIGEPGQRTEAGSRGCGNRAKQLTGSEEKRLTALVPVYGPPSLEKVWGVTTAEYPTFWFYVPHSAASTYAEFVLEDAGKHQTIYKVPLAKTPGVISISLPSTARPLEVGKPYHWYFNVYCQKDHQVTAFVEGDVQRQPLNFALKQQLDQASPQQRVNLYATHGIWYDALTTLAELRRTSPQDENLATDWTKLLQSIGLESFAPVADCCRPDN